MDALIELSLMPKNRFSDAVVGLCLMHAKVGNWTGPSGCKAPRCMQPVARLGTDCMRNASFLGIPRLCGQLVV